MKYLANPTATYRAAPMNITSVMSWAFSGEPIFRWIDVPVMAIDPAITYGMGLLRSPYAKSRIKEGSITGQPHVKRYLAKLWKGFWKSHLPRLLDNYFHWGRAPGGVEWVYDSDERQLKLDKVRAIEPNDATPRVWERTRRRGQFAGFDVTSMYSGFRSKFVGAPFAFWFSGFDRLAPYCDRPRLASAHAPWLEKTAPMGLRSARRLQAWCKAVGITVIRHPGGDVKFSDGSSMSAEDRAGQIALTLQNGTIVGLPSKMIGDTGKYEWDIDQRNPQPDSGRVGETIKDVDEEIWFALGIPPEIVRAQDVGSGYSGRAIPMETWLANADETSGLVDRAFRDHVACYGVRANFGKQSWDYELVCQLDEYLEATKSQTRPGEGEANRPQQPPPDAGRRPPVAIPEIPDRVQRPAMLSTIDAGGARMIEGQGRATRKAAKLNRQEYEVRTAAALAMIEHRLAEMQGGAGDEDDNHDHRASLAELADDPEEIAKALGSVNLSWVEYGKSRSGGARWRNSETGKVRYQQSMPGTARSKREAGHAKAAIAHTMIQKVVGYQATADDLRQLAEHIPALTVDQLRTARQALQARFGNARRRDAMVKALQDHVHGRADQIEGAAKLTDAGKVEDKAAGKVEEKPAAEVEKRDDGTPEKPETKHVYTVPTSSLSVDPERMQYKVSGIGKGGVGDELKGTDTWNHELGGTLLVWRDPETGKDIVVNGHHRFELADRVGQDTLNARYIDAPNAKEARARGALANIAEGRGTALDAAKYLRDSGQDVGHLKRAGVSLSGKVAADAATLTHLADEPFQALTEGRLDEPTAVAVAKHLHDPAGQKALFKKLAKREDDGERQWSPKEIEQAAKMYAAAGKVTEKGSDLFGDFEDEKSTFDQEVELRSHVAQQLSKEVGDYAAISSAKRADRVSGAGNQLAVEENQRRKANAETRQEVYNRLQNRTGPIAEAIKESAAELAVAKTKREKDAVKLRTVERVNAAVGHELAGGAGQKPVAALPGGGGAGGVGAPGNDGGGSAGGPAGAAPPDPAAVTPPTTPQPGGTDGNGVVGVGGGGTGNVAAGDRGGVAEAAGGPGDATVDSAGESEGESRHHRAIKAVSAATQQQVNGRLDKYSNLFRRSGKHELAGWLDQLRSHVNEHGVESTLSALGEDRGAGTGDPAQYEGWWIDPDSGNVKMGQWATDYLDHHGVQLAGHNAAGGAPLVSSSSPSQGATPARGDRDFTPADPTLEHKLAEAKKLPGLESSEDINHIAGHPVTHLTPEVTAKLDEKYGHGKWIVKAYGDDAAAGYGIYFPQRAAKVHEDARNTIDAAQGEIGKHGFTLARDESGKVTGVQHAGGDRYDFGTEKYQNTLYGDVRHWADRAAQVAEHEKGAALPGGGKEFMAQPAFPVVGISDADRAAGMTIKPGQEGRVHVVTRNGKAEVIPHSTWLKEHHMPVVFENEDTKAMAKAAQDAIDALPESEKKGQIYAPDVVKTADGYRVVEANPANHTGSSGYLGDNPLIIDSYVSHLMGRTPAHVRFIRKVLAAKK